MRWIRVCAGVLVGLGIWGFAFLVSTPDTVCYDHMPATAPPGAGAFGADYESGRAPLPIPAARCTTVIEGTGITATSWVVDWTATALASLGIVLIVVSLWTLKIDANARQQRDSPGRVSKD
jgi:hypothetical protein